MDVIMSVCKLTDNVAHNKSDSSFALGKYLKTQSCQTEQALANKTYFLVLDRKLLEVITQMFMH